ncbi:unnamed protein product [Dimorphilus gyrociliatus]|uniref:Uncharacterized protein n=1 Tax=Dimorphilus gyrociliatus TaxID=2664684 RepID=A0A7I8WEE5_9ANNE|nr:unnamed protein product [Dimorphilus gyrociliatus]
MVDLAILDEKLEEQRRTFEESNAQFRVEMTRTFKESNAQNRIAMELLFQLVNSIKLNSFKENLLNSGDYPEAEHFPTVKQ